jgi:ATP-binding cassette subfamily C (CFTR/MRP) protein 1
MPSVFYDNGEAVTLMSSDVDGLEDIARMFHETWAQVIEVVIGLYLLAREVGWFWPLPLLLIFCKLSASLTSFPRLTFSVCSRVSKYVANNLGPRQKKWNEATQNRIGATSSMISSMKSIKMLGLQTSFASRIQKLRVVELSVASRVRQVMVYYNSSGLSSLGLPEKTVSLTSR